MDNITTTGVGAIDSLVLLVKNVLGYVSLMVGGVFGLYVVLIYMRWKEAKALRKGMEEIKSEIRSIRENVSILETVSLKELFENNGTFEEHVLTVKKPALSNAKKKKVSKKSTRVVKKKSK